MSDQYRLVSDRGPAAQLTLGLAVRLDPPAPIGALAPGDRFLLEGTEVEGRLESRGSGSATVALWRQEESRWNRTTWSLSTLVRRLRG